MSDRNKGKMVGSAGQQSASEAEISQRLSSVAVSDKAPTLMLGEACQPETVKQPRVWCLDKRTGWVEAAEKARQSAPTPLKQMARPGFVSPKETKFEVLTNYMPMKLDGQKTLYVYEVDGISDTMTRPKKRVLMNSFIEGCEVVRQHRADLATDYQKTIVAWRDLFATKSDGNGNSQPGQILATVTVDSFNPKQPNAAGVTQSLHLKFVRAFSLEGFANFSNGSDCSTNDPNVKSALNIIITDLIERRSADSGFLVGSNRVYARRGFADLGSGNKIAVRGYSYTVSPGVGSTLFNVLPVMSAFYKPVTVAAYLKAAPSARHLGELKEQLENVRVWLNFERTFPGDRDRGPDTPERRTKTIRGFGKNAENQSAYTEQGKLYTVWEHFEYKYGKNGIQGDKKSVCVNLGGESPHEQWYLAEDLVILPGQRYLGELTPTLTSNMIKQACRTPQQNINGIVSEFMPYLSLNNAAVNFYDIPGTGLRMSSQMLSVPASLAYRVTVQFSGNAKIAPNNGTWDLKQQRFLDTSTHFSGNVHFLLHEKISELKMEEIEGYLKLFFQQCSTNGLGGLQPFTGFTDNYTNIDSFDVARLGPTLQGLKAKATGLVVLILPKNDQEQQRNYAAFKSAADQVGGIKSLCLCNEKILKCFFTRAPNQNHKQWNGLPKSINLNHPFSGYARNIGMKLNVRLGNKNFTVSASELEKHIPQFSKDKNVMILGADVVHPSPGALDGTPSIAALVGSID